MKKKYSVEKRLIVVHRDVIKGQLASLLESKKKRDNLFLKAFATLKTRRNLGRVSSCNGLWDMLPRPPVKSHKSLRDERTRPSSLLVSKVANGQYMYNHFIGVLIYFASPRHREAHLPEKPLQIVTMLTRIFAWQVQTKRDSLAPKPKEGGAAQKEEQDG